jgi:hypothetical protein
LANLFKTGLASWKSSGRDNDNVPLPYDDAKVLISGQSGGHRPLEVVPFSLGFGQVFIAANEGVFRQCSANFWYSTCHTVQQ